MTCFLEFSGKLDKALTDSPSARKILQAVLTRLHHFADGTGIDFRGAHY
jgi:hypothetical protein